MQIFGTPAEDTYRGCGNAWVGIDEKAKPLVIKYMADHPYFTGSCKDVLKRADRVRVCESSKRLANKMNDEAFTAWRLEARAAIEQTPGVTRIISGMLSGGQFIPNAKHAGVLA